MHFKRKHCKRQVRCTICTEHRWRGNSKDRFDGRFEMEKRLADEEMLRAKAHLNRGCQVRVSRQAWLLSYV